MKRHDWLIVGITGFLGALVALGIATNAAF
jgi:short subunit dehydrogenase-like uncharacterized protein